MTNTFILIPCIKFLLNLIVGCMTVVAALYILLFAFSIIMSLIVSVFFSGRDEE